MNCRALRLRLFTAYPKIPFQGKMFISIEPHIRPDAKLKYTFFMIIYNKIKGEPNGSPFQYVFKQLKF